MRGEQGRVKLRFNQIIVCVIPKTYATDDIISPFGSWGKGETRGWDHDGMKRFEEGVSDEDQCMKKGVL